MKLCIIVEVLVLLSCVFCSQSHTSFHHHHKNSRRSEYPRLYHDNNEYPVQKSHRRQEVIHALNDDSEKTDDSDDIDSLGTSMDATGAEIKDSDKKQVEVPKVKQKDVTGTTKDIIQKIKEIQDRLFKRTGSKKLESKLKQMEGFPDAKQPLTEAKKGEKTEAKSDIRNDTKTSENKSEKKVSDGSKKPDRRKIIPEEVVDKILEKFQQLRQEAKHMALLDTKHDAEKESSEGKSLSHSPYETIGPAKPNAELKNRTQEPDIQPAGVDEKLDLAMQSASNAPNNNPASNVPNNNPASIASNNNPGSIEIPIGNAANQMPNNANGMTKMPNMPVMFIRNGQMLVPVFGSNVQTSPMSVTGNAMAQFNGNPGVAMPNLPNNVVPMSSPQQLTAAFMGSMQNTMMNGAGNQFQPVFNQQPSAQYIPARSASESASSRCDIPGASCPTPTQSFAPQQNPTNNIASVDNAPSTSDLIKNILNAPGFPQLAARLMSESYQGNRQQPQMGDSRGFNNMPPIKSEQGLIPMAQFAGMPQMGDGSQQGDGLQQGMAGFAPTGAENAQGLSPGSVQFNLQNSLASNPGQISMLQNQPASPDPMNVQRELFKMQQPTNPSGPLMGNPFQDAYPDRNDNMEQMQRENQIFSARNIAMNDISDPAGQEEERGVMQQQTPEQLLNFAKYKNMQDRQEDDNGQQRMGPTRMSMERGGTERSLLSGVDPGSLLDKLHGAQLKVDMMGAGDPQMFSPTYKQKMQKESSEFEGNPDDLLEMLRRQNDKVFHKNFGEYSKSRLREQRARSRQLPLGSVDPSFADDISNDDGFNQPFDVQSKSLATENEDNQFLNSRHHLPSRHDLSVLPDNFVQYKHGRMSMDSADVVNSFFRDPQYYRNKIAHPPDSKSNIKTNKKVKPVVRASITKTLPEDNVELRVNGKKLIDKNTLRSKIVNGKIVKAKGKTLSSKGPVQIELSHGEDKRKIINIITKSKYNVTEDRRRTKIPKVQLIEDD